MRSVRCLAAIAVAAWALACGPVPPAAECIRHSECTPDLCIDFRCQALEDVLSCPPPRENERIGNPCGACGDGRLTCDADRWTCVGDTADACGGCSDSNAVLGDACGTCGGEWTCDGATVACSAPTNPCGGCGPLTAGGEPTNERPGDGCTPDGSESDEITAVWSCVSATAMACLEADLNACGGSAVLDARPGDPCGACRTGRWECNGSDGLRCCHGADGHCEAEPSLNVCGGCAPLADLAGEPCGPCATGAWTLDCTSERWICEGHVANPCGGCGALSHAPGTACATPGTVRACVGPEATACVSGVAENPCGGEGALALTRPGAACGPCADGVWVCAGPSSAVCAGATNAQCGSCAPSRVDWGAECGADGVWACDPEGGALRTCEPGGRPCTPEAATAPAVWSDCGCNGVWACTDGGPECIIAAEDRPRVMYVDADGDGYGDESDPGSSQCGRELGYSRVSGDCDDATFGVNPGVDEVPGNGRDDDCDPVTVD